MARRSISLVWIDQLPEDARAWDMPFGGLFDCVPDIYDRSETPLGELMWLEVYCLCRRAHLDGMQTLIVEGWLRGYSDRQIAEHLSDCLDATETREQVKNIREHAITKIGKLPALGLPSVLIEIFGPKLTMMALSDESMVEYGFKSL